MDDEICRVSELPEPEGPIGTGDGLTLTNNIRPVFLISSDVKIGSGNGTEDNPYELEIAF